MKEKGRDCVCMRGCVGEGDDGTKRERMCEELLGKLDEV